MCVDNDVSDGALNANVVLSWALGRRGVHDRTDPEHDPDAAHHTYGGPDRRVDDEAGQRQDHANDRTSHGVCTPLLLSLHRIDHAIARRCFGCASASARLCAEVAMCLAVLLFAR
jgi:hypothetical protein